MVSCVRLPNPDSVSQRLLARAGASAPPLGLHAIVNFWKDLDVLYEELDGAGYLFPLGHLGAEIIVNKNHPAERQRFTIAHEIGHWVLGLTWQKKIGEFRQPLGLVHETIAKWCDSFATNLLMPGLWIKAYFAGATGPSLIEFVTNAPADFSVSKEAMFVRLWGLLEIEVVKRWDMARGGAELKMERSYSGHRPTSLVAQMLNLPEVGQQVQSPFFYFAAHVDATPLICSGKQFGHSLDRAIILAVQDG